MSGNIRHHRPKSAEKRARLRQTSSERSHKVRYGTLWSDKRHVVRDPLTKAMEQNPTAHIEEEDGRPVLVIPPSPAAWTLLEKIVKSATYGLHDKDKNHVDAEPGDPNEREEAARTAAGEGLVSP